MSAPALLLLAALAATAAAFAVPGLSDLALVSLPAALAAALLWLRARRAATAARPPIVVDGSNVMHWRDNTPSLDTLRAVLDRLTAAGYAPGVVFDANAGYLISGRYQNDGALARSLGLPADRIWVVPKGRPADPAILTAARGLSAPIVTNDRYRDWLTDFPEAATPGRLIRGGYRDGTLWLDLPQAARQTAPSAPR